MSYKVLQDEFKYWIFFIDNKPTIRAKLLSKVLEKASKYLKGQGK
jgi:hypothetical protein